jgi:hypothetical protein
MKMFWVLLLSLTVIACGKIEKTDEESPVNFGADEKDITAGRQNCVQGEPQNSSIFQSHWRITRQNTKNGVLIQEDLSFAPNQITKRVICSYDSQQVEVIARADATVRDAQHEINISKQDLESKLLQVGKVNHTCRSEIYPTVENWTFKFLGTCVNLKTNAGEITYVPSSI